jgi:hypothetical protein
MKRSTSLVVLGIFGRLLPHPPNFTPVDAVCLFSGAQLRLWQAFLTPLVVMAVTDGILTVFGGLPFSLKGRAIVYASLLLNVVIGRAMLSASRSALRIGVATALCSAQFYLLTNFGVWWGSHLYPQTAAGLAACYAAGLPFLGRTLAGDLLFSALVFGLFHAQNRALVEQR